MLVGGFQPLILICSFNSHFFILCNTPQHLHVNKGGYSKWLFATADWQSSMLQVCLGSGTWQDMSGRLRDKKARRFFFCKSICLNSLICDIFLCTELHWADITLCTLCILYSHKYRAKRVQRQVNTDYIFCFQISLCITEWLATLVVKFCLRNVSCLWWQNFNHPCYQGFLNYRYMHKAKITLVDKHKNICLCLCFKKTGDFLKIRCSSSDKFHPCCTQLWWCCSVSEF